MASRLSNITLRDPKSWLLRVGRSPRVVYEDEDVVIVTKPSGMHTVNVNGKSDRTLVNWMSEARPEVMQVEGRAKGEGGILHRLDGATSGLVLAARHQRAFQSLLSGPPISKGYLAYCTFDPAVRRGPTVPVWPKSVDSSPSRWHQHLFNLNPESLIENGYKFDIVSQFTPYGPRGARVKPIEVIEEKLDLYQNKDFSDMGYHSNCQIISKLDARTLAFKVWLQKGFRHQIRSHLSYIGCPIIGDPLYPIIPGKLDLPSADELLEDIGLYAISLSFQHPSTNESFSFELPPDQLSL